MSRNIDFRKAYQNKQFIVNAQWGWRALCLKKESSFHGVVLDSHDLFCRFWTLGRTAWSALSECTCVTPLLATFCLCAERDQILNFNSDGDLRFTTGLPAWICNSHSLNLENWLPSWKLKRVQLSFLSGLRIVKNQYKIKDDILELLSVWLLISPPPISLKGVPRFT